MEKTLKLYQLIDGASEPFPNIELQAELYSFQYDAKRMGDAPSITGTIMFPLCLDNLWSENVFVEFRGERYFKDLIPSSSYSNKEARYMHEITFVSERKILEDVYFKDVDNITMDFHFFGDLLMCVQRLNDFFKRNGIDYNCVIDDDITTEELDVAIDNKKVNETLQYIFERFDIPYYFVGKTIHFGYSEHDIEEVFEYGITNALLSISKDNKNERVKTAITGVGSSENIPYFYPNFNESGEHEVTTTPAGYVDDISKINYLKIDPYTNLRDGGWAKYHKACVNPIGNDTDDVIIYVDSQSGKQGYKTEWSDFLDIISDENGVNYLSKDVNIKVHIKGERGTEVKINKSLSVKHSYNTEENINPAKNEIKVYAVYNPDDGFFNIEKEDLEFGEDNGFITFEYNCSHVNLLYVYVEYKYEYEYLIGGSTGGGTPITDVSFSYDTKYHTNKQNLNVKSEYDSIDENVYLDFNKVIDYPNGQYDYRNIFTYKVTREVAGYSTVYLDTIFRGMFLKSDGNAMTEWYKFTPSSVVVKDSDGNIVTERWFDSVNEYIHFRNTSETRKTYIIEMNVVVNMTTPNVEKAYGVKLYYNPDFGRYEYNYDYWKFHDSKPQQKYSVFGVKFADKSSIPDSLLVNFSETKNWIAPKPNLMPSIYRSSLGTEVFYYAQNNTHIDENGNYIDFVNIYNPAKPKELIADPKEDIKPTVVRITNAQGQRIDMFSDVFFNPNDNNDEWITDENGSNQELKHSFFFVKLRKFDGENGFNLFDQALDKDEMVITMTSGHCGSCDFKIMVNENGENPVQVDDNGDLLLNDDGNAVIRTSSPQPQQQDTSVNEVWIMLKKEEDSYGVILPDSQKNLVPIAEQDTFVFTNILLPDAYITNAEKRLENALLKELKENNEDKFNFSIDFSRIYFAENESILSELNENARVKIKYNNNVYPLYVSSFSYIMNKDQSLPQIKVDLSDDIIKIKTIIEKSEIRVIREVKKLIIETKKPQDGSKGNVTINSSDIDIVQTTGSSKTSVMSQKAVTDAIKNIEVNSAIEISQYLGDSETKTVSQKTITKEFENIRSIIPDVVNETGQSIVDVMSQKSTTDAINDVDKVLHFDGFIDDVEISFQTNPYEGGKIFFVKSANRFAYYRKEDDIYTAMWNNYTKYATFIQGEGIIPNSGVIFTYNNGLYIWNGETLESISLESEKEILPFGGILDSADVVAATGFNKNGVVYFIKTAIINAERKNNIFAYKIRETYYQSWHNVYDYMTQDLSSPIDNKLFEYNRQQYIYSDEEFDLLANASRLKWKEF